MKNILFIGQLNNTMQDINKNLSNFFNVQLCSENPDIIRGIIGMCKPDLVLVSLAGLDNRHWGIMDAITEYSSELPVLCLATKSEQDYFSKYLDGQQFKSVTRPVSDSLLVKRISERLGIVVDDVAFNKNGKKRKQILLVDDDAIQLRTLRKLLIEEYDVSLALSGAEAIVAIGKSIPDLIFLDYEMPVVDGKQTFEMIRNIDGAKDVPVVFFTGVRDRAHIEAVLKLKPAGYIIKPTEAAKIMETIKKIFGE